MEIEIIFKKLLQLKTESAILNLIKEEGKPGIWIGNKRTEPTGDGVAQNQRRLKEARRGG